MIFDMEIDFIAFISIKMKMTSIVSKNVYHYILEQKKKI